MELTLTTKYALQSLAFLARRGGDSCSVREVCQHLGVPQKYLGRLMPRLGRAGLVSVQRGAGGGYRLARPPRHISLSAVVEAVQGLAGFQTCMLGLASCSGVGACAFHEFWAPHRAALLDTLARVSVADLARGPDGGPAAGLPGFRTGRGRGEARLGARARPAARGRMAR